MSFFEGCRLRLYSRKIFWKTVSFFGPPCCCKGVEGENEERPLAGRRAAAKKRCKDFFRKNVVLEAWRLRYMTEKEISRWYWLRIGASWRTNQINGSVSEPWKEKTRTSTVWHQFWCRFLRPKQSMASILTPLKKISPDPYIFHLPMTYHLRGISKFFSEAPIKTALLIPYLVRGARKKFSEGLIFRLSRDLPLEGEIFLCGTHKIGPSQSSLSEGIYWNLPITRKIFLRDLIFCLSRDLPLEGEKFFGKASKTPSWTY